MAACGAAVLIALQLGLDYWFFLYVVWFFPLVLVALLGRATATRRRGADAAYATAARSAEAGRGGHEQLLDPVGAQRALTHARITTAFSHGSTSRGLELDRHLRHQRLERLLALDADHAAARARSCRRR